MPTTGLRRPTVKPVDTPGLCAQGIGSLLHLSRLAPVRPRGGFQPASWRRRELHALHACLATGRHHHRLEQRRLCLAGRRGHRNLEEHVPESRFQAPQYRNRCQGRRQQADHPAGGPEPDQRGYRLAVLIARRDGRGSGRKFTLRLTIINPRHPARSRILVAGARAPP